MTHETAAMQLFARAFGRIIGSSWLRLREVVPITAFLVVVTGIGRVRRTSTLLGYRVYCLWRDSGSTMCVQYLKEAVRLVFQWKAGHPEPVSKGTGVLVRRDSHGLPCIIPHYLRVLILGGDVEVVKVVLTILSFYRVIRAPKLLKLHTITNPGTMSKDTFLGVTGEINRVMAAYFARDARAFMFTFSWLFSTSAGPNGSHATWTAPLDAAAFLKHPRPLFAFMRLAPWFVSLYMILLGLLIGTARLLTLRVKRLILGRLHTKEEAAGKVRVFAITDWWTQGILDGLHRYLFGILSRIKQDGTFDQLRPIRALLEWVRLGLPTFSYDLSAATDRLPVSLQVEILSHFVGPSLAKAWKVLLVGRPWWFEGEPLRYSVGQPMGALSSWAMLALTHHVLVQISAKRVGWQRWFPFYAVLGDDIVIADAAVAQAYYSLITDLGVEINLGKSIVSESGVIEFAKRLISPHFDYSPIGPGVLLGAFRNGSLLVALFTDALDKSWKISPHHVLGSLSEIVAFYRTKAIKARALKGLVACLGPTGVLALPLADWISLRISPVGWRAWLTPGLAHAVLWVITSLNRTTRDNARSAAEARLADFMRNWPTVAAQGFPALLGILGPGFWIYVLALQEILSKEVTPYSTRAIREATRWDGFTPAQISELVAGADFDWGPLAEAMDLRSEADKMARLRSRIISVSRMWSPDASLPGMELVPCSGVEDTSVSQDSTSGVR